MWVSPARHCREVPEQQGWCLLGVFPSQDKGPPFLGGTPKPSLRGGGWSLLLQLHGFEDCSVLGLALPGGSAGPSLGINSCWVGGISPVRLPVWWHGWDVAPGQWHTLSGAGTALGMLELAGSWDKALGDCIWQQSRGAGCGWGTLWSLLRLSPVFFHECGWQGGGFRLGGRIGNTPRPQAIGNCWHWSGTGWVLCPPPPPPQAQGLGYF